MELQNLADLNIGGAKQAGVGQKAESKVVKADSSEHDTSFKDQVKKQIDQSKTESNKDKNDNNQQDKSSDGEPVADAVVSENETQNSQEETSEQAVSGENTLVKKDESELEEEVLAFNDMLNITLAPAESMDAEGTLMSPLLPEEGKPLPLSSAISSQVQVMGQQGGVSGVASKEISSQQAVLTVNSAAQSVVASQTVVTETAAGEPDLLTADLKAFKSVGITEKPGFLNSQSSTVKSELPAAEMIANASRMQQIPLATAISSSVNTAQNLSAAPAPAVADTGLSMSSAAPLSTSLSAAISAHVQGPEWSGRMTEQVSIMVKRGFQQAEIKLNPAHLGPLEVKLNMSDDKANISFVTQHAPVKEAIDSAMPRLRDMLEEQGLSLADFDVSTQSEQQQAEDDTQQSFSSSSDIDTHEVEGVSQSEISSVEMEIDTGLSLYA